MALDPATQVAEEDKDLPQKVKETLKMIPEDVKFEVRRAHHTLGHPARDTLLRLAKAAGKSEEYLTYIKYWRCPVCLRRERPGEIPPVGLKEKAQEFNVLVGVDLKEVPDVTAARHAFLNILDVATRFSVFARLPDK